jgi:hypothetical protein
MLRGDASMTSVARRTASASSTMDSASMPYPWCYGRYDGLEHCCQRMPQECHPAAAGAIYSRP